MNMSVLETQLVMICHFTDTIRGCQVAIKVIDDMEREAETVDEADMLADTKNIIFNRGNVLRLEERGEL